MHIQVITLFPELFTSTFSQSIISRAIKKKLVDISYIQIRQFATDSYGTVDDHPYGGGHGMVLRVDVIDRAIQFAKQQSKGESHTVLFDASGTPYTQKRAKDLSEYENLILICGHYEGVDARIFTLVDEVISIGDYILTGGEIPAMVIIDSVSRLLPGVLSKTIAVTDESFSQNANLLEHPQYTRPDTYNGMQVPQVLLGGNHKEIEVFRRKQAILKTKKERPDLIS